MNPGEALDSTPFAIRQGPTGKPMLRPRPSWQAALDGVGIVARLVVGIGLVFGVFRGTTSVQGAEKEVDFTRDIRPILSELCFTCHGPDEKQRKGKYRVDTRDGAFKNAEGKDLIVGGKADASEFYRRLVTEDEDDRMPPPKKGRSLSSAQVTLVKRWIDSGARWNEHWAFLTPKRSPEPEVGDSGWVRNAVDRYVLSKLETEGLRPSREAERSELLRRVSLDLTGLPPTPEELDAYLADADPKAYEKVVDRLLQSPRYGEHMARTWLDAVRYADTHGYHIDSQRDIWPYRDWVIRAFNDNMRFDRFTTEQIAGDLLPEPTVDQRVATGFVRCNMSTGEGGVIEAEYSAKYAFDRVETLGTVYLGATLICARCHSHKYDPYPMNEYYGVYSFFNNLAEPVMDGNKPNPEPFLKLPTREQTERLAWLKERIAETQRRISEPNPTLDAGQKAWAERLHGRWNESLSLLKPDTAERRVTTTGRLAIGDDGSVSPGAVGDLSAVYDTTWKLAAGPLAGLMVELFGEGSGAREETMTEDRYGLSEIEIELRVPKDGKSETRKLRIGSVLADTEEEGHSAALAIDGKAETSWSPPVKTSARGHRLFLVLSELADVPEDTQLAVRLRQEAGGFQRPPPRFRVMAARQAELTGLLFPAKPSSWRMVGPFTVADPGVALDTAHAAETETDGSRLFPGVRGDVKWQETPEIEDGKAHTLVHELHGVHGIRYLERTVSSPMERDTEILLRSEGWYRVWVNGQVVAEKRGETAANEGPRRIPIRLKAGRNEVKIKVVSVTGSITFFCQVDPGSQQAPPPALASALVVSSAPGGSVAGSLRDFYRRQHSPEMRRWQEELAAMREENGRIDRAIVTTLVAKELPKPRDTYFLVRGEYDKPSHKVPAAVFGSILPFPEDAAPNRLGLARWLMDPRHPLTARVTVNRFWQGAFGIGLVRTSDDFGSQGERPSHPELLDWLATEFVASGWDVKHMHRMMVTSATYRQTSRGSTEAYQKDPDNRLLGRGPRHRLDGEVLRDLALAVGGVLSGKIGGPSVKPYEPAGLWEAVSYNNAQRYVQDRGEGNYRRSLYTFWKRQSPPPNMLTFDAPTRETCTVRRPRTNTPMQALATLNDPQFVEASRALANRMVQGAGDRASRLRWGFRLVTARVPTDAELRALNALWEKQLAGFRADPSRAVAYLAVGEFQADTTMDRCELAAWAAVANVMLNLDETLTKS